MLEAQFAELFVIYRKVCTAATVMVLILNSWADSTGAVCPIRCSSGFVGGSRRESAPFSSLSSGFSIKCALLESNMSPSFRLLKLGAEV